MQHINNAIRFYIYDISVTDMYQNCNIYSAHDLIPSLGAKKEKGNVRTGKKQLEKKLAEKKDANLPNVKKSDHCICDNHHIRISTLKRR